MPGLGLEASWALFWRIPDRTGFSLMMASLTSFGILKSYQGYNPKEAWEVPLFKGNELFIDILVCDDVQFQAHKVLTRAGCINCRGTKCPLLTALFLFLLLQMGYISPRRDYRRVF